MDENNTNQSADDALQPQNDVFNPATDAPKLEEDNNTPTAPADPVESEQAVTGNSGAETSTLTDAGVTPDHPVTDSASDIDATERYDEGTTGATGATDNVVEPGGEAQQPLEPTDEDSGDTTNSGQ